VNPCHAYGCSPASCGNSSFRKASGQIVAGIWPLVPAEAQRGSVPFDNEVFEFVIEIFDDRGSTFAIPESIAFNHGPALDKVLHRTPLFNNLLEKLELSTSSLKRLHTRPHPE
jgi:hypothetical protein